MIKDGDLLLLKIKEQRRQEELERAIKAIPLLQAARLPLYIYLRWLGLAPYQCVKLLEIKEGYLAGKYEGG